MEGLIKNIGRIDKRIIAAIAFLLLVITGMLDFYSDVQLSISIFYLLPITISAWYIGRKSGLFFALLGAAVWSLNDYIASQGYRHPVTPYWNAVVMLGIFLVVSEILSALRKSVNLEEQLAIRVQKGLLPNEIPVFDSLQISVKWQPLSFVSGDYYDLVKLDDNKLGICIADVSGHGVAASLLMSNIQAAFHVSIRNDSSPEYVCGQLNTVIRHHGLADKFVSFFYGIIDLDDKSITYSNAGHPPPFIIRNNGTSIPLDKGGTMLGIVEEYFSECERVEIKEGDVVIVYTDGITEAKNRDQDLFGEDKMIKCVREHTYLDSQEINNALLEQIGNYNAHNYDDDYTLLILKYGNLN